ncbi:MAG: DUF116 domain-containing protein [bacterium]
MQGKIDGKFLGSIWQNEKNIHKISEHYNERKLLFFIFAYASVAVIACVMAMMWYVLEPGLERIHQVLPGMLKIILSGISLILLLDISLMALSIKTNTNLIRYYHAARRVEYLMPLVMKLGILLGIVPDRMISSFIGVNNHLIKLVHEKKKKENILVLLPRCLQHFACKQSVVSDINACKSCGKCDIAKLVKINKDYRLVTAVATGGGLAKSLIRDLKPHGVIAVACERELIEGLKGVSKIPIIAIANSRPEGPCKNTKVDIAAIESAVKLFKNI